MYNSKQKSKIVLIVRNKMNIIKIDKIQNGEIFVQKVVISKILKKD